MPCMVFNISYDILFYMNMGNLLAICKGFIHCILSKLEGWVATMYSTASGVYDRFFNQIGLNVV